MTHSRQFRSRTLFLLVSMVVLASSASFKVAAGADFSIAPFPGNPTAQLIVADGWAYIVRGTPPVPVATWKIGESPPLPPGDDLAVYTADLVRGLGVVDEGGGVAALFSAAATRIDTGELRGSAAIVESVSKPLAAKGLAKWQAFSTMLFQHLLNERRIVSQADWAAAYKSVAAGLRGEK